MDVWQLIFLANSLVEAPIPKWKNRERKPTVASLGFKDINFQGEVVNIWQEVW